VVGKRIKLYGERNTGTRYLTRLFEHNLGGEVIPGVAPSWTTWVQALAPGKETVRDAWFARTFADNFGWKHSRVQVDRLLELGDAVNNIHFVALVKNPYSWLLSLDRRPYHLRSQNQVNSDGIKLLLTTKWPTVGRENGPAHYRDAIDLWNDKVRSYFELVDKFSTTLLTYEELVLDPALALSKVKLAGADTWLRGQFENLTESTKEKGKDSSYYRDYYGNERWRSKLMDDEIAMVNTRLDRELMAGLGYRVLE